MHKAIMIFNIYSLNILKNWYSLDYQTYTNTYNSSLDKRQNWTSISTCVSETEEKVSSITDGNTVCHAVFAQWFYKNISLILLGLWVIVRYKKIACSNNLLLLLLEQLKQMIQTVQAAFISFSRGTVKNENGE